MGKTAVKPIDETDAPAERILPKVLPDMVTLNGDGFAWRTFLVRMPDGAIGDDLKSPGIWRVVQHSEVKRLRENDHLFIVGFDRSWCAECIVTHTSLEGVTLGTHKLISMPERTKPYFSDGKYRVKLHGNGFIVERISDLQIMTDILPNEKIAERALVDLYPKVTVAPT